MDLPIANVYKGFLIMWVECLPVGGFRFKDNASI